MLQNKWQENFIKRYQKEDKNTIKRMSQITCHIKV